MKENNENDNSGKNRGALATAATIAGILTPIIGVYFVYITLKGRRISDEIDLENKSIQCSINNCGKKYCIDMFTNKYNDDAGIAIVTAAANSNKLKEGCGLTGINKEPARREDRSNRTSGPNSPIISNNQGSIISNGGN